MPPRRRHYEGFVVCNDNIPQRGKMMTWSAPFYQQRILEIEPISPVSHKMLKAGFDDLTYKSVMLEWKRGLVIERSPYHDKEIDFWVPAGESVAWAIDKLLSSYTEQARKERAR